jgi:hypothetical protein
MSLNTIFTIINDGLLVEDKTIKLYSSILDHSEFINTIPEKERIKTLLNTLINESSKHEKYLKEIKSSL